MKVTLFKAFPDSYRQSMSVYADCLLDALRPKLQPTEGATAYSPNHVFLSPRLARYWSQYVRYQFAAVSAQGDINHVIDHAYSHLLLTLDSAKTVVTFHDAIGMKFRNGCFNENVRLPQPSLIQRYNLLGLKKARAVICDSEASRKDFLRYTGFPCERVKIIYPGVEEAFFQSSAQDPKKRLGVTDGKYLLHVGHTKFYKNIPALFHVLSILIYSLGQKIKLIRVGTPFTSEQLHLARTLRVTDHIVDLGAVERVLLPDVYRSADVFLYPSLDEGFGLPALEAMASGTPVVASNCGSLPEVVGDAGILVDPRDHTAIAKSIVSILDNSGLRSKLREAGINRARYFTWEKTAEQTLEVYRKLYQARWKKDA